MVPFAAPYKAVFFKYIHYNLRNAVLVFQVSIFVSAFAVPLPVIGVLRIQINSHPETMHTVPVRTRDIPPGECAADIGQILFQFGMLIQFL